MHEIKTSYVNESTEEVILKMYDEILELKLENTEKTFKKESDYF